MTTKPDEDGNAGDNQAGDNEAGEDGNAGDNQAGEETPDLSKVEEVRVYSVSGDSIFVHSLNLKDPKLTRIDKKGGARSAGYGAISTDGRHVFLCENNKNGSSRIHSFSVSPEDGKLTAVNKVTMTPGRSVFCIVDPPTDTWFPPTFKVTPSPRPPSMKTDACPTKRKPTKPVKRRT